MKLLLIEDDGETAAYIAKGFRDLGHVVDVAGDGREGLYLCTNETYEMAIVDRRLPSMDGLSLVKAARAAGVQIPILFLTTVDGVDDRVEGLGAGGDDYLVKPFAFSELVARINALARRAPLGTEPTLLQVADLKMDLIRREVMRAGRSIELLPREFRLLEFLMRNAGQVVTRTMLLEHVWDIHFDPKTNVVETHISRLRAKVDRPFGEEIIHTVHRAGYRLHAPQ
jgi:two-component system OmpR family response regulator